jgi:hypothetical protein
MYCGLEGAERAYISVTQAVHADINVLAAFMSKSDNDKLTTHNSIPEAVAVDTILSDLVVNDPFGRS